MYFLGLKGKAYTSLFVQWQQTKLIENNQYLVKHKLNSIVYLIDTA